MRDGEDKGQDVLLRWEALRRQQLGFVNNVILGLAVGIVAFEINLFIGHPDHFDAAPKLAAIALLLAGVSALCGLFVTMTRLLDFRATAEIHKATTEQEKVRLRRQAYCLGRMTWGLLWIQLFTFLLSLVFSAGWVWALFSGRVA